MPDEHRYRRWLEPVQDRELLVTSPDGLRGLSMVDPALDPNAARVQEAIEDFLRRHAAG
jgi:hypothetical protein